MTGKKTKNNYIIKDRIQLLNLKVVRCANPGPCSSQPQGHKTAYKFPRIRCTICFTSPEDQKERKPHLQDVCLPDSSVVTWCNDAAKVAAVVKNGVSGSSERFHREGCIPQVSQGTAGAAGYSKNGAEQKANCYNLLKRIIKLKLLIQSSRLSTLTLKRVASNGSMAPCRSHHGNHTRQEWIIIWSGRNWILKHAD